MTTISGVLLSAVSYVSLLILLSGCAQVPSIDGTQSAEWPTYQDPLAQSYISECRRQHETAAAQLRRTEKQDFPHDKDFLQAINQLDFLIDESMNRAGLYANVHPLEDMRAAGDLCEQRFMSLENDILLSAVLYQRLLRVKQADLVEIDRQFVLGRLEKSRLKGAHLPAEQRERVRELNDAIVKTGQEFLANIRMDTRELTFTPEELRGLPEDYLAAHPPNAEGRVVLATTYPDYLPVMLYAQDDSVRLRMYKAFRQRGYPVNREVLRRLLSLRHEFAKLLGYEHFADYITADKMVGSAQQAAEFIDRIHGLTLPRAQRDSAELLQRLRKIDPAAKEVGEWQKSFLENLIKSETYALDAQELRRYFAYDKVRQGIFNLVENMFNVSITPWQTEVWHESVEAYEIRDQGRLVGQFYLDMQPRAGKYSHAAHFGIRYGAAELATPLSALVCNFPIGEDGKGLLEHDQVETFLHEFGHLLHSMFGGHLPWISLAGTNVQRDFVEAPSMMLEEWIWDRDTLRAFATDANGRTIPDELIERMNAARQFGKGLFVQQQLFYATLSLNFYNRDPDIFDLDATMLEMQRAYSPFAYVGDTFFYASFGHLDNYSAMYYTYMWSLALATDMFSEFQRAGLRNPEVARRYRDRVLAPGASKPAAQLVQDFLGRPFSFEAFARSLEIN
jgi:thimet oligopeptidase